MASEKETPSTGTVSTSSSLLLRVKERDSEAWRDFVRLYTPMVYCWARRAGLQEHESADVVQEVFLSVTLDIHQFARRQSGDRFRNWLWVICRNKVHNHFRQKQKQAEAIGGSTGNLKIQQVIDESPPDDPDARNDTSRLRHRALNLIRQHFDEHVWQAFLRVAIYGDKAADVAEDLNVSVSTIYRARWRVFGQLRDVLSDLWDEDQDPPA